MADSTRKNDPGAKRARAFRATIIKLGSFVVVMVLVFVALVVVFSKYRSGSTREYTAVFTSASALKSGSSVEIAGVETLHLELRAKGRAEVVVEINDMVTARGSVGTDGNTRLGIFYERDY